MSYGKKIYVAGGSLLAITISALVSYECGIVPKYFLLINIMVDLFIFIFIVYCIYKDKKESKEEERKFFEQQCKKTGKTYEEYLHWLKTGEI